MRAYRSNLPLVFGLVVILSAAQLAAQMEPAQERGFAADRLYSFDGIDSIDLASGNLVLTIPIGPKYSVGGGFSYGFTLVYNAMVWDFKEINAEPVDRENLCFLIDEFAQPVAPCTGLSAYPTRTSNAGLGWTLSLGRLLDPLEVTNPDASGFTFIAPDGSKHSFGDCSGTATDCPSLYPHDGKYLRMRLVNDTMRTVDTPDGTSYHFSRPNNQELQWQLDHVAGPPLNQNWMHVTYGTWTTPDDEEGVTWTITDSAQSGRSHVVFFGPDGNVDRVELDAFGGSTAVYSFSYQDNYQIHESYRDADPNTDETRNVTVLTGVSLPDGTQYSMLDAQAQPAYLTTAGGALGLDATGALTRLVLPTGGSYEWEYQKYRYYSWVSRISDCDPSVYDRCIVSQVNDSSSGIKVKTKKDVDGTTLGVWTHRTGTRDTAPIEYGYRGQVPQERWVVVQGPDPRQPTANAPTVDTIHYFRAQPWEVQGVATNPQVVWDFGLPYTRRVTDPNVPSLFLSSIQCDGPASIPSNSSEPTCGTSTEKQKTYVAYDHDTDNPADGYRWTNRWMTRQRTYFVDDTGTYTEVEFQDPDGLGNLRTKIERSGGFADSTTTRTTFTGFNRWSPGTTDAEHYPQYIAGADDPDVPPTRRRWPVTEPWILRTAAETKVTETKGASTSVLRRQACLKKTAGHFPLDTVARWQRTFASLDGTAATNDAFALMTVDSKGNVTKEEYFGGDLSPLPSTTTPLIDDDTCAVDLPTGPEYTLAHTYTYGVRATSKHVAAGITHLELDLTIDGNTGLASAESDADGVATVFEFDALGRLTVVKPAQGGAWSTYTYTAATSSRGPQAQAWQCANGVASCDGTALASQKWQYDGLGRVIREMTLLPDGTWNQKVKQFQPSGHAWKVSETEAASGDPPAAPVNWTTTSFDWAGRPLTVVPPDASGHAVSYSYTGARVTTRTVKVKTTDSNDVSVETPQMTTEVRDSRGRLASVQEPVGLLWTYTYDVGDKLVDAAAAGSSRYRFSYDGRGLLLGEDMPEKTLPATLPAFRTVSNCAQPTRDVCYAYDARGHVRRKLDGEGFLGFAYDAYERLTSVVDKAYTQERSLKSFEFYDTATAGQRSRGKLKKSTAHNYVDGALDDRPVTQEYTYDALAGRVATRTTSVLGQSFATDYTWNDLGALVALSYPHGGVPAPARTVRQTFTNGFLTAVPVYASSIAYHPNGVASQVVHANGVTDAATIANGMARPAEIKALGAGGTAIWTTGAYAYDGAGNVKATGADGFVYDGASRLVKGELLVGGVTKKDQFTYDGYGNLTNIRRTIGAANPEDRALPADTATNRLTIGTYDHAGNQTALTASFAPNQTYTYDPLDQMRARSVTGSRSFVYLYDADGERVAVDETTTGTTRMLTLRGLDGKVLRELRDAGAGWAWAKDYVYRGGTLLASVSVDGGIRHYHLDHLSTPRLHTDRCGAIAAELKSFPYGESAT